MLAVNRYRMTIIPPGNEPLSADIGMRNYLYSA